MSRMNHKTNHLGTLELAVIEPLSIVSATIVDTAVASLRWHKLAGALAAVCAKLGEASVGLGLIIRYVHIAPAV